MRVGIIGTGSTAVQIVSAIVDRVATLSLFQRTAQWVMPQDNPPHSDEERASFRDDPEHLALTHQSLSDLFDLFSKVGAVKNVEIAMDRHANRSKGFGFVEMETLETAKEAAAKLNRTDFLGRQIVVSGAKVDKRPVQSNPREADPTAPAPEPEHEHAPEHEQETGGSSTPDATI